MKVKRITDTIHDNTGNVLIRGTIIRGQKINTLKVSQKKIGVKSIRCVCANTVLN